MDYKLINSIEDAIEDGKMALCLELIDANPEIRDADTEFGSWLHIAAAHGQLDIVKELALRKMDVNARGGIAGGNALHSAVGNNHIEVVKYLLDAGAKMDVTEPERNPLFGAILEENVDMGMLLIERGIDWKVKYTGTSMKDMDALAFAKERGAEEFVKYLESLSDRE